MEQKKYKFGALRYNNSLPPDVNNHLISFADKIKCEELKQRISIIEQYKQFGRLRAYDSNWVQVLDAYFRHGINKQADIMNIESVPIKKPLIVTFNRTLNNPNVSFKREDEYDNEVRETKTTATSSISNKFETSKKEKKL